MGKVVRRLAGGAGLRLIVIGRLGQLSSPRIPEGLFMRERLCTFLHFRNFFSAHRMTGAPKGLHRSKLQGKDLVLLRVAVLISTTVRNEE